MVALQCCLEQLEPNRDDLKNADNRLIWCNRVQCISPIIRVMKSLISEPSQQQIGNAHTMERLQICRCVLVQSSWSIWTGLYFAVSWVECLIANLGQNTCSKQIVMLNVRITTSRTYTHRHI